MSLKKPDVWDAIQVVYQEEGEEATESSSPNTDFETKCRDQQNGYQGAYHDGQHEIPSLCPGKDPGANGRPGKKSRRTS